MRILALILAGGVGVAAADAFSWGVALVVAGGVFACAGALFNSSWLSLLGGLAMIGGFFAPWIDSASGFDLATRELSVFALACWLVPVGGVMAFWGGIQRGRALAAFGGVIGLATIAYLTYRVI